MDQNELIQQAQENIKRAIEDYGRYIDHTRVLDDISERFIVRLAKDSVTAKQELRELFSKSPVWDAKLDALVINGTRTHNPNYNRVEELARKILTPAYYSLPGNDPKRAELIDNIERVIRFFSRPNDELFQEEGIAAMHTIAPKAYAPGKKLSRVFKAVCTALGVVDESTGSEFQKLYAQFADELTSKKIGFKLYVSINPAHFLTMSNPKFDSRGNTLTSCHSFNSTEYQYNNGCTGYARDKYTFIVFTAADPAQPETLNNRKTTRQIFAYKPGNGLLLQSRFYNTSGGVYGAAEDSKLYRDLIQRELSMLEHTPNLWKTYKYVGSDKMHSILIGSGFGGYADWTYENFDGKISIREDHENNYEPLRIGTFGICVNCADETSHGVYCSCCDDESDDDDECCEECENYYNSDDMWIVRNSRGYEIRVCTSCRDQYYSYCDNCEEYYPNDHVTYVAGENFCEDCLNDCCSRCDCCDEYYRSENGDFAVDGNGTVSWVCNNCIENEYIRCDDCSRYTHENDAQEVFDENGSREVCVECSDNDYDECTSCGNRYRMSILNSRCHCRECSVKLDIDFSNNDDEIQEVSA